MGLFGFGSKKQSFLGVDIGAGGIKLVELHNEKGRARLFTYGFTERAAEQQPVSLIESPKETAELLRKIAQKAKVSTMQTIAGLPISSVFSSVIIVPKGNDKEVKDAVAAQARKLIPIPLEEMVLDFKIIPPAQPPKTKDAAPAAKDQAATKEDPKKADKTVQVLVTGAAKNVVQKYVAVFRDAKLELKSLETEAFALIRSLIGKDRATTMVVDIGAVRTNVFIVERGIPFVTRSLDMGGLALTRAMAKALSLDAQAAEHMKCDIKSVQSLYQDDGIPKIFEATIGPLLTELQYSVNQYVGTPSESGQPRTIEKVILTGGTAALPAIAPHFAKQLGIKVYVGDPWARVVYPEDLRPVLDEIGPRYAVGLGLAMRDIE